MTKLIRLHKFLADCGLASRRKAEALISAGKVRVNGEVVTKMGVVIDKARDKIYLEGRLVRPEKKKIYLKLNKPPGYVSSCRGQRGEKTVLDLVKAIPQRLFPIGRLDKNSEGLMILTNDGELANRLMHPRYEHEKEYLVNVQCPMTNDQLRKLKEGVIIEEGKTLPAKVFREEEKSFRIILREGKKRQIRLMVEAAGNRVVRLKRIRIKNLTLGSLPVGRYALLTSKELQGLL